MRRSRIYQSFAAMLTLTSISIISPTTASADTVYMYQDTITLNGTTFSKPYGFVEKGVAYVPVTTMTALLNTCGFSSSWNGKTGILSISEAKTPKFTAINRYTGYQQIQINGKFYAGFRGFISTPPSSNTKMMYAPMNVMVKALKGLGINGRWNAAQRRWTLTSKLLASLYGEGSDANSGSNTSSDTGSSGDSSQPVYGVDSKVQLQNGATDDSQYWSRADKDLYISAQTFDPNDSTVPTSAPKMLNLAVGQKIDLFAYSGDSNVQASQTTWDVNSSYATLTPDSSQWQSGSAQKLDEAHATFVASKPGIYTVQADVNGNYTIPLVLTVGYSSLVNVDLGQPSSSQTGVQLFPQTNADFEDSQTFQVVTANEYAALVSNAVNGGWIPIQGFLPSDVKNVSIVLESSDAKTIYASYTVPAYTSTTGQQFFRAEVLSPLTFGPMQIEVIPELPQYLTQVVNSETPTYQSIVLSYNMSGGAQLTQQQLDVLPTAKIDYNMSSDFQQIAETLMENSPSVDAGFQAINNYVSNLVTYDDTETQPGGYRLQDAVQTLQTGTGVCEDYAELTAALLRSIGIQTETILGKVQDPTGQLPRDPAAEDNHEWLKAWDGNQWLVMDPTWSFIGFSNGGVVSSAFFTATNEFTYDHDADSNAIGNGLF